MCLELKHIGEYLKKCEIYKYLISAFIFLASITKDVFMSGATALIMYLKIAIEYSDKDSGYYLD